MTQQPFDGDRARAQADIPQKLAVARRQCRYGDGADFALGELAVVLEQRVVEVEENGPYHAPAETLFP